MTGGVIVGVSFSIGLASLLIGGLLWVFGWAGGDDWTKRVARIAMGLGVGCLVGSILGLGFMEYWGCAQLGLEPLEGSCVTGSVWESP